MSMAVWMVIQVTKKFYHCSQKHTEYLNRVTFPCCRSCHKVPIEGITKLIVCFICFAFELASATNFGKSGKIVNYDDLNFATIFAFFILSSIIDIITHCKGKLFVDDLDYAFLSLTFAIQAILYGLHIPDNSSTEWTIYSLLKLSAFSCCLSTLLEMKFRDKVYCPLLRGYCLMVLGSWSLHSVAILSDPQPDITQSHSRVLVLSMYFTWHCATDLFICLALWLFTIKLYRKNICCCLPLDYNTTDTVYLENRVRFDYHVLDRLESDLD